MENAENPSETPNQNANLSPNPEVERRVKEARTALIVVAVLQTVGGLVIGFLQDFEPSTIAAMMFIAVIFWVLWFWARKNPLPATIAGLITFVTVHFADALVDPAQLARGIIMKIIVISVLIKGVMAGIEHRKMQNRTYTDTDQS